MEEVTDREDELADIYYQCMALGFVGRYKGDAEELRRLKRRLYRMLPGRISEEEKQITPDAYFVAEGVKDIYKPLVNLGRVTIACVTVLIVLWGGFWFYRGHVIPSKIRKYEAQMRAAVKPAAPPAAQPAEPAEAAPPPEATPPNVSGASAK
jgi:type VI protein secretion system component VasF